MSWLRQTGKRAPRRGGGGGRPGKRRACGRALPTHEVAWHLSMTDVTGRAESDRVVLLRPLIFSNQCRLSVLRLFCPRNLGCMGAALFVSCFQGTVSNSFMEVCRWQKESPAAPGSAGRHDREGGLADPVRGRQVEPRQGLERQLRLTCPKRGRQEGPITLEPGLKRPGSAPTTVMKRTREVRGALSLSTDILGSVRPRRISVIAQTCLH